MKLEKWHVLVGLVCFISGVLIALNYKVTGLQFDSSAQRNRNLVSMIRTQERNNRELEKEIGTIRGDLDSYQKAITSGEGSLSVVQKNLSDLKLLAGLVEMKGPGIVVTLKDHEQASSAKNPEDFMIHYSDILYIVNDLRSAGAEAISVNGIRIVTTSDIRCAGNIIQVNARRLAPPYTITAIGDQKQLELFVRSGTYYALEAAKFPVSIEKSASLTVPAYKGSYTFNYAKTDKKAGVK